MDCEASISTKTAPVTVEPKSLILVMYTPSSATNKSVAAPPIAEKPLEVPLALSVLLKSNDAAAPPVAEALNDKPPVLTAITVGENPASLLYVSVKEKKAKELGLIDGIGAMQDVLTEKFGDNVKIKQITQKKGLFSVAGSSSRLGAAISYELIEHLEHRHLWTRFGL